MLRPRIRVRAFIAAAAFAAAACSKSDGVTAPPKPASVEAGVAAVTTATVGAPLMVAPTFTVKDASGNALGNVDVSVAVTAGGGTLSGAPAKSAAGATAVGTWTLGNVAGVNTLTVTVAGLAAATISVTGKPDLPSVMTVVSGNGQRVPAGSSLSLPVSVRVADKFGNGVPGVAVAFSVTDGQGVLEGSPAATTGADGSAAAPSWTLGKSNVPQQLRATAGALSASVSATVATNYLVDVRFFGPAVDPGIAAAFTAAANRVSAEIVGGVQSVEFVSFDVAQCGITGVGPLTESVPSVIIYATVKTIDGVGKIIGSSGPCIIRSSNKLALVGVMQFDVADLQTIFNDGRLNDVIMHEMHHVLGYGTVWNLLPVTGTPRLIINAGTSTTAFTGASAINGCIASGGGQGTCLPTVPLENTGGPGTADGHWRESIFRTELMTGFVSAAGVPNPLSQMTIGSMADLGYVVNYNSADNYSVGSAASFQLGTVRGSTVGEAIVEQLLTPRFEATRGGGITRIPEKK
jgi:hypothetical protein